MSNFPFYQNGQGSGTSESNAWAGFDSFNTFLNSGIPNATQPAFSQPWIGTTAWNSMPTLAYDASSPFHYGMSPNNNYNPYQQNDTQIYSDDDFYDNSEQQSIEQTNVIMDSKNGHTNMTTTTKAPALISTAHSSPHKLSSTTSMTTDRAKELREKLLASKRASSATPLPTTPSKTNEVPVKNSTNPSNAKMGSAQDTKERTAQKSKDSNTVNTSIVDQAPAQHAVTTTQPSSRPSTLPSANADIQGLIDEYRAPEVITSSEIGSATKELQPKLPSELKILGAASEPGANGTMPQSRVANGLSRTQNGSPRSSESGEIRSDQEPEAHLAEIGSVSATALRNGNLRQDPPPSGVAHPPNTSPQSKSQSIHRPPSKPKTVHLTPKQSLPPLSQFQDTKPSTQLPSNSRSTPSAWRVLHRNESSTDRGTDNRPQKPAIQSPTQQVSPRPGPEHHQLPRKPSQPIAALSTARPGNEASRPQESKQDSVPQSKPQGTELRQKPAVPVESKPQVQPRQASAEASVSVSDSRNILTIPQQKQIQGLGLDLSPEGLQDLHDFLYHHHFFVDEYRRGFLDRQRRLRAIEEEKLALERESLQQFNSMRGRSASARERSMPPTSAIAVDTKNNTVATPSISLAPLDTNLSHHAITKDSTANAAESKRNSTEMAPPTASTPRFKDPLSSKRPHVDDDTDPSRNRKVIRVDSDAQGPHASQPVSPFDRTRTSDHTYGQSNYRGRSRSPHERRTPSPHQRPSDHNYPIRQSSWRETFDRDHDAHRPDNRGYSGNHYPPSRGSNDYDHYSGASQRPSRGDFASSSIFYRGGSRGRAGYQNNALRRFSSPHQRDPARQDAVVPTRKQSLNLEAGDSRYFMIKSWNLENVEAAQRDNVWATQPQNLDILTEAFNTCRNVILVFSVNKSRAFQGYARMHSLPSPSVPAPAWQRHLLWASTDPFRIRWVTVAETRFHLVGHLKNACNEGQAVLVGRDGQEIEEGCGRRLCGVIDEVGREEGEGRRKDRTEIDI